MVNYCTVYGCGRNSKSNFNLSFYSLPNEKHRQIAWLKASGREHLLELTQSPKASLKLKNCRFCSRHFALSCVKNKSRHLESDAVPTLFLPGQWNEEKSDDEHEDVYCNVCKSPVVGFRYKCVSCQDFDLCHKCETLEAHRQHFMLRIPRPIKFKAADQLIKKWRKFFKAEHVTPDTLDGDVSDDSSDDDQPITKYAKNYDSGIDLSEDVKETIRKEIQRVANLNLDLHRKTKKRDKIMIKMQKQNDERKRQMTKEKEKERVIIPSKILKVEDAERNASCSINNVPEVVFADVNNIKDLKPAKVDLPLPNISSVCGPGLSTVLNTSLPLPASRIPPAVLPSLEGPGALFPEVTVPDLQSQQPVMHVKLSDDLTQLMIEVTSNNQRTIQGGKKRPWLEGKYP